jgi:O-antigen/teichoic acid export membrane protein
MKISIGYLLKGSASTIGADGFTQALRLVTNVILARLLAPELFGIMLIVNTLRTGIELMSDVGIGQNIIYHKDGNDPDFYNTAWTLQAIRGVAIWLLALAAAVPFAKFYQSPIIVYIVPFTTFNMVLVGFTSISPFLLRKRLQITKLNIFEVVTSCVSSAVYVLLAYLQPNIWSLVFGGLFATMVTMTGSYFLLSDVGQRFHLSKRFTLEILHFGKWIFLSTIVYFLSTNFDRLYLAKVIPLKLLGVYGIAHAISDLAGTVVMRLGNYVLFPFIASHSQMARNELHGQLAAPRLRLLALAALGFAFSVAAIDLTIKLLYDQRYHAASWMLPVLLVGSWFAVLANLNEATLLGLGKPLYSAVGNGVKFAFLLIGLPLSVRSYGVLGGIFVVVLSELSRYIPLFIGQRREQFSFGRQDVLVTLGAFAMLGLLESLRWMFGFGTSFESLPMPGHPFGNG